MLEEGIFEDWFESYEIVLMIGVVVFGFIVFIWWELIIDYLVVNIWLYFNYNFVMGSIMNFMFGLMFFGIVFIFLFFV